MNIVGAYPAGRPELRIKPACFGATHRVAPTEYPSFLKIELFQQALSLDFRHFMLIFVFLQ